MLKINDATQLREQDLSGHLEHSSSSKQKTKKDKIEPISDEELNVTIPLVVNDYYLSQALNLLKGIHIIALNNL